MLSSIVGTSVAESCYCQHKKPAPDQLEKQCTLLYSIRVCAGIHLEGGEHRDFPPLEVEFACMECTYKIEIVLKYWNMPDSPLPEEPAIDNPVLIPGVGELSNTNSLYSL